MEVSRLLKNLGAAFDFFKIQAPVVFLEIYEKFNLANRSKMVSFGFLSAVAYLFLSNIFNIFWFGLWTVVAYSVGFLSKHYLSLVTASGTRFEISDLPVEAQRFPVAMEVIGILLVTGLSWFLVGLGMTCWMVIVFHVGYLENKLPLQVSGEGALAHVHVQ